MQSRKIREGVVSAYHPHYPVAKPFVFSPESMAREEKDPEMVVVVEVLAGAQADQNSSL